MSAPDDSDMWFRRTEFVWQRIESDEGVNEPVLIFHDKTTGSTRRFANRQLISENSGNTHAEADVTCPEDTSEDGPRGR